MNLFFGASNTDKASQSTIQSVLAAQFGKTGQLMLDRQAGQLGYLADSAGVVFGQASTPDGQVHIVLLGCLNCPVPGWSNGSPMDDANATARYLLERYQTDGTDFTKGLIGQFAIAVADCSKQRVLLANDPTGIRTIFHHVQDGDLNFSTNLALLAKSTAGVRLNREYEDFFLCYGYFPAGQTMFSNIGLLKPGTVAIFENGVLSEQSVASFDPWSEHFPDHVALFANEESAIDGLERALMLATEQQLASDSKVAVLLGGADSALVASLLHRAGKQVETFSFYYEDVAFNQPHTDTLSRFLGIRHHWIPITTAMMAQGIDNYPWEFNFPTNWPNYVIQTQGLTAQIRDAGFRYIYSGDGCDGTFLGYPRTHVFAKFLEYMPTLPPAVGDGLTRMLDFGFIEDRTGRLYTTVLNAIRSSGRVMPARGYSNFKVMDENALARLKGTDSVAMARANEGMLRQLAAPLSGHSLDRLAYAGKNALSPNRSKLAGSSDTTGAIINSPYLHSGMKRFATAIPDHLLRPQGRERSYNGKYLLFKTCETKGLLPPEIIYQRKISAVDAPMDDWYSAQLRGNLTAAFAKLPFPMSSADQDRLLADRSADRFYRKHISSDALTSHAACLLATYAQFAGLVDHTDS